MEQPTQNARERFAAWCESVGGRDAARQILDCHATYPGMVIRGERIPQRKLAHAIERATASWPSGPIAAEEWDSLEGEGETPSAPDAAE